MKLHSGHIYVIGAGAVGRALAVALRKSGIHIEAVFSRRAISAERLKRSVRAKISGTLEEFSRPERGIILIAVPDDTVPEVARKLAMVCHDFRRHVVLHTSGTLSSASLAPLRKRGAAVGSFHPLQTFPKNHRGATRFNGIWIAVEGDDRARETGAFLAKEIGAKPFIVSGRKKKFYHIAAVFASNYFVTLLSAVETLGAKAGLPRRKIFEIFEPLIKQTLNNVKQYGAASALTGPIKRGDIHTVEQHIAALAGKENRYLLALYAALGRETLRLARGKK
ncbi:MAG: DUF2520 domain-containing protein [Bacteroidota bacterium]|nr:DUF2520 domain-containing protein [Bacteroidota bacterium]